MVVSCLLAEAKYGCASVGDEKEIGNASQFTEAKEKINC